MKDRIKEVRISNNLSLTKFAEKIQSSVATVSRYESGERVPSDAVLKLISKEFGVSYAWLKTGEGPMEDPIPDTGVLDKLTEMYASLPERLASLVDALAEMDPDWWKTLDAALEEIERRKNKRGTD